MSSGLAQKFRSNYSTANTLPPAFSIFDDRPDGCPPCFNCNLEDFQCQQFADCSKANGRCVCPPGYGGEDCSAPLCGSLADGKDRTPREGQHCDCKEGWEGINCNVCKSDDACAPFMPEGEGGVCYQEALVIKENYQMCDITNKKILEILKERKAQATFSCNAEREDCNFQFWVDELESFYCALDTCSWITKNDENRNTTEYDCDNIKCRCIPGRFLCGEEGSVDIGEFLDEEIKGPASFSTTSTEGGSPKDGSKFEEPAMNQLISSIFGDNSITLQCHAGECVHVTEVPGYEKPVKKINTPLIAGVIAGCALFVVFIILLVWYMSHRSAKKRYGPIHLSDEDEEETAKLLADHKPAALYFDSVSYRLNGKEILSSVSGTVHPGEIMAIMGASGAGKTTFLDILARKNKIGTTQGNFYVNGERVPNDEFKAVIGFVDQEDTMLPTLTVHETILDSALLRLPKDMKFSAKVQKVEDVERQLGIYHIRDQIIGSEEGSRGISGGEKRRVGIACELVTSPSILFLDEPTSGLDAFNAFNVVECLVNLVKVYNRTVIFTIHQPRSNIVALFDQLVLLAKGRTVYSGPLNSCQPYFDHIGYTCPPGFNIADYLVDLTMHAGQIHEPIDENSSLFAIRDGMGTRASSAIGVKSIPSISNFSLEHGASSPSDSTRPRAKRKASIKQQQERHLFTRKRSDAAETPKSGDEASLLDNTLESTQQWLKLSKTSGLPPPQILDDPHQLPPPASGTGTNLDILVASYAASDVAGSVHDDIQAAITNANSANSGLPNGDHHHHHHHANNNSNGVGSSQNSNSPGVRSNSMVAGGGKVKAYRKASFPTQLAILSRRTWRNLYRNPMLMLTHYAIAIVLAVLVGFLFYGLTDDIKGFQNRLGLFFFLLALFGFSTLTSLTVFAPERLLFVRERAKGYYNPLAYFAAKLVFDMVPLRLVPPFIMGAIVYPMTGLVPAWPEFWKFILFLVLFNLAAAAICLFLGVLIKNAGVANLIGSLVMLFSLLFGGFLLNHESIPGPILWLQLVSEKKIFSSKVNETIPTGANADHSFPSFTTVLRASLSMK